MWFKHTPIFCDSHRSKTTWLDKDIIIHCYKVSTFIPWKVNVLTNLVSVDFRLINASNVVYICCRSPSELWSFFVSNCIGSVMLMWLKCLCAVVTSYHHAGVPPYIGAHSVPRSARVVRFSKRITAVTIAIIRLYCHVSCPHFAMLLANLVLIIMLKSRSVLVVKVGYLDTRNPNNLIWLRLCD